MNFISRKMFTKIALSVLAIYVIAAFVLTGPYNQNDNLLEGFFLYTNTFVWFISSFIAFFISLLAIKKIGVKNNVGKSILFLGLSALFSGIGIVIWDIYVVVFGVELPYPSLADVSWFLQTPLIILATFYLSKIFSPNITSKFVTTGIISFIIIAPIMVHILGGMPEVDFSGAFWASFFDLYYSLSDAIAVTMAVIIIIIAGGKIFPGIVAFMISIIFLALGDTLFAIRTEEGLTYPGDISDLSFSLSAITLAAAIYLIAKSFIQKKP